MLSAGNIDALVIFKVLLKTWKGINIVWYSIKHVSIMFLVAVCKQKNASNVMAENIRSQIHYVYVPMHSL